METQRFVDEAIVEAVISHPEFKVLYDKYKTFIESGAVINKLSIETKNFYRDNMINKYPCLAPLLKVYLALTDWHYVSIEIVSYVRQKLEER